MGLHQSLRFLCRWQLRLGRKCRNGCTVRSFIFFFKEPRCSPYSVTISGNCSGHAKKDRCGIIYGGTSGRLQTPNEYPCPPILYPPSSNITIIPITVGPCFEGNNSVYYYPDCADECNGTAVINDCLECVGGTTGRPHDYGKDCAGVCGGSAFIDHCGVCTAGSTGIEVHLPPYHKKSFS